MQYSLSIQISTNKPSLMRFTKAVKVELIFKRFHRLNTHCESRLLLPECCCLFFRIVFEL